MRRALAALAAAALVSCQFATHRTVMLPDGLSWYLVKCRNGFEYCLDEAQTLCPRGYVMQNPESHGGATYVQANGYGGAVVATQQQSSMMLRCKL